MIDRIRSVKQRCFKEENFLFHNDHKSALHRFVRSGFGFAEGAQKYNAPDAFDLTSR